MKIERLRSVKNGIDSILTDEAAFWKVVSDRLSEEPVELSYSADAVLSDLNNIYDYEVPKSMTCGRNLKRSREIVCRNCEDDFPCNNLSSPKCVIFLVQGYT